MIFYKYMGHRNKNGSVDKYWGELKQKHKKQSFGDASDLAWEGGVRVVVWLIQAA